MPQTKKPTIRRRTPRFESSLVRQIVACVRAGRTPWGQLRYVKEFEYGPGRTDVLGLAEEDGLIAFEAKLTKWRDAVIQAYRNRAYVDLSYIVLPRAIAERATVFLPFFIQYGVGLCTIVESELKILIPGEKDQPIQGWLAQRARETLHGRYAPTWNPARSAR